MRKLLTIILALLLCVSIVPSQVDAITLAEYEKKLKEYKDQQAENQASINQTQGQINSANANINGIKKELVNMGKEIEKLEKDVVKYKEEIEKKDAEIKKLVEYLQLSGGENVYLEYAFGADNITDLIYRMSIVEQMTKKNDDMIKELKDLIQKSNDREKEINTKEKELSVKQDELSDKVQALGEEKESLQTGGVSIAQQVKIYQTQVDTYKKLGCKSSDRIGIDCAKNGEAGIFRRPTKSGYITSEYGYRWGKLHRAVDVGNKNPYSTKIYPVANGRITSIHHDLYGALVVLIEHNKNGKIYTSNYAHLSKYSPNIYVGKYITSDEYIGYMGATGYVTGPHLHLEIYPCRLYNVNDKNCSTWSKYVNYAAKLTKNGYKGPRSLINFPKGLYNSWSTR